MSLGYMSLGKIYKNFGKFHGDLLSKWVIRNPEKIFPINSWTNQSDMMAKILMQIEYVYKTKTFSQENVKIKCMK